MTVPFGSDFQSNDVLGVYPLSMRKGDVSVDSPINKAPAKSIIGSFPDQSILVMAHKWT